MELYRAYNWKNARPFFGQGAGAPLGTLSFRISGLLENHINTYKVGDLTKQMPKHVADVLAAEGDRVKP